MKKGDKQVMNRHTRNAVPALGLSVAMVVATACAGAQETEQAQPSPQAEAAADVSTPQTTEAQETVNVRYTFDWKPDGDWAPMLWAEENGYFAEEGLTVEYVAGDGSSAALPLIAAGEMDMGQISAPPVVLSVSEELPITSVGVQQPATPLVLVANAGVGISEPQDLEGHRVAVQEGEFEGAVWDAFTSTTGIDRSNVEEVPAAGGADVLFIDEQVDAIMDFYTSGAMVALTEGHEGEETLFQLRDYLDILGHTTVVNNTFLNEHPDAVRGFLRAWAEGMKYTIDHPEETVDLLLERYPENEREAMEWSVPQYAESWMTDQTEQNGLLSFTSEGWEATKAVLVDGGLMDEADVSGLFTTEYLPDPAILP